MIVVVKKCEHLQLLLIGIRQGQREEVICSVDFSKNYDEALGMKLSPYLLQHVTTGLVVHSVVIVSNETIHQ